MLQKLTESPDAQPIVKLGHLERVFRLNGVRNAEIKFRWLRVCVKARWHDKLDGVLQWLNVIGRMKFVRPLYRDLYAWEDVRQKAIDNFKANRPNMMHVSAYTLAKDLHLDD